MVHRDPARLQATIPRRAQGRLVSVSPRLAVGLCAASDAKLRAVEGRRHRPVRDAAAVDPVLHGARLGPGREVEQQEARVLAPARDGEVLAAAAGSLSRSSDVGNSFGVPPMPSHAYAFGLWLGGNNSLHFSHEVTGCRHMEGGMSRTQKIDRARRNALKAASLVGCVLGDRRSAQAGIGSPRRQRQRQRQDCGNGQQNQRTAAAVALRGARRSGRARAIGRSKPWQWATRLRCVSGASRRSRQWSVTP